ncbi:helix-turn-helix domain-containing protein [Bacillus norwichensis]|uniref:Helix-turn-helix domain-containing protein n=1 Tax=Bacillus norwichensis TaxID=2762217 RepID=A0ABR8VI68_9BACI|nr:helix-turn-helix domain-containing protein [Bacillus norwichensis]MBD8004086.1 helix-turn-helix domain-containing protein [Bacillus norwichensis]
MSELGGRLRTAREEKGISLDQLQSMTKIQKKYLSGIEKGDYSQIPGKFYVRAFIKQYAEAVGLSPDELFEEYKNEIPAAYEDDLSEQLSRVQTRRTVSPSASKIVELLPKILIGVAIVAVLFLAWYLFSKSGETGNQSADKGKNQTIDIEESDEIKSSESASDQKDKAESNEENGAKDQESKNEDQELTMDKVSGNVTTYKLSGTDKFELKVSAAASGETWVKVLDGGNQQLFQGMLQNGASESFDLSDQDEAYIRIGRAFETDIYINDQKLEYELDPNQNVTQEISILFDKE